MSTPAVRVALVAGLLAVSVARGEPPAPSAEKPPIRLAGQFGHLGGVTSIAYSPDGRRVLTGGIDGTAHLWDVETGCEVQSFPGKYCNFRFVAFAPDGKRVLTGEYWGPTLLWEVETGEVVRTFGRESGAFAVAVSPDGKRVLTAGNWHRDDPFARLWDIGSGKELRRFKHPNGVESVVFHPGGKQILTGCGDGLARLWDVDSGKAVRAFAGTAGIRAAAFSPDGARLVIGERYLSKAGWSGAARLFDAKSGKELHEFTTDDGIWTVAIGADAKTVFTGSRRSTLWDSEDGRELRSFPRSGGASALSPDGKTVAFRAEESEAAIRDSATGRELRRLKGHSAGTVTAVAFSARGDKILVGANSGSGSLPRQSVQIWSSETGRAIAVSADVQQCVVAARFSPDGKRVLVSDRIRGGIGLLDAETGKEVSRHDGSMDHVAAELFRAVPASIEVEIGTSVFLFVEPTTRKVLRRFATAGIAATTVVGFDAALRRAVLHDGRTIWFCDLETGNVLGTFGGYPFDVRTVAVTSDGARALTGGLDGTARLWDCESGKELCRLITFCDGTWAVTDSGGRFDGSNNGDVPWLHWVVGDQVFGLAKFKDRYFDPGLLAKYMGFERRPLREVR